MIRSPIRSPIRSAVSGVFERRASGGAAAFNPAAALFGAGELGAWYDPSDITTLFQDSAGTVPVTTVGQVVGRINDKSGRGNHATQTTTAQKPIYRIDGNGKAYLEFDGIDDSLSTVAVSLVATAAVSVFVGAEKMSDAAAGIVIELSANSEAVNGAFLIANRVGTGPSVNNWGVYLRGTAAANNTLTFYPAPDKRVITANLNIAAVGTANEIQCLLNGAPPQTSTVSGTDAGTGNFGNHIAYIGRRGGASLPFNGKIYNMILRGAATSGALLASTETYMNSKTGAY